MARPRTSLITVLATASLVLAGLALVPSASAAPSKQGACTITGTNGPDTLRGTSGDDVICGLGGNDKLYGLGGNDVIIGGPGDDELIGGPGDDRLIGGQGDDETSGGPGKDHVEAGDLHDYGVFADVKYALPAGTTVKWEYSNPDGNCLAWWETDWKDTIPASGTLSHEQHIFQTRSNGICNYETSRATYFVTIEFPSGHLRTGRVRFQTLFNPVGFQAESSCDFGAGTCSDGSDFAAFHGPKPPVSITATDHH